jgi:hypothetical protein
VCEHAPVRRSTVIVLVALGAVMAGFAVSSTAERLRDEPVVPEASARAGRQSKELGWRETYGPKGKRLEFRVDRIEVLRGSWQVRLGVSNDSSVAYAVGNPRATLDRSFGLMLFSSGDSRDLEERNESATLPAVRPASRYEPSLPPVLEPHSSWEGTISAPGALVAGSWVRVVFGTLVAVGRTPDELPERFVWITDHAYRLRR